MASEVDAGDGSIHEDGAEEEWYETFNPNIKQTVNNATEFYKRKKGSTFNHKSFSSEDLDKALAFRMRRQTVSGGVVGEQPLQDNDRNAGNEASEDNTTNNGVTGKLPLGKHSNSETRNRRDSRISLNRNRLAAFMFLCREEEVRLWLEIVLEIKLDPNIELSQHIRDGVGFIYRYLSL
jgi:hypothetical protein